MKPSDDSIQGLNPRDHGEASDHGALPEDLASLAQSLDALAACEADALTDSTLDAIVARAAAQAVDPIAERLNRVARMEQDALSETSIESIARDATVASGLRFVDGNAESDADVASAVVEGGLRSGWRGVWRVAAAVAVVGTVATLLLRAPPADPTTGATPDSAGMVAAGFEPDRFADEFLDVWDTFDMGKASVTQSVDDAPARMADILVSDESLLESMDDTLDEWSEALLFSQEDAS